MSRINLELTAEQENKLAAMAQQAGLDVQVFLLQRIFGKAKQAMRRESAPRRYRASTEKAIHDSRNGKNVTHYSLEDATRKLLSE